MRQRERQTKRVRGKGWQGERKCMVGEAGGERMHGRSGRLRENAWWER